MKAARSLSVISSVTVLAGLLASAAPIVRSCPFGWNQVPLALLAQCSGTPDAGSLPPDPTERCLPKTSDRTCPMASPSCSGSGACPLGTAETHASASATPHSLPASDSRRALCLTDPFIARGWRPRPPTLPVRADPFLLAWISAVAAEAPAPAKTHARPEFVVHDSGVDPDSRPPVRGPPLGG